MLRSLFLALLASVVLAASAAAERPKAVHHGPSCTPAGCAGREGSPTGRAAGFGLAVLAALALQRRRDGEAESAA